MSGFFLKNDQREHLKVLREKSSEAVVDLCKLAIEYLTSGPSEKKYAANAKKHNISLDSMQPTIEALVCLLIDATKSSITETEFESLKSSGFSGDQISILWQFVSSKRYFVESILKKTNTHEYRYRDLDWRLEAKVASRSLLHQATPLIAMKFYLDSETVGEHRTRLNEKFDQKDDIKRSTKEILVQTDPNNLLHIIDTLEHALDEAKLQRSRNMAKALQ